MKTERRFTVLRRIAAGSCALALAAAMFISYTMCTFAASEDLQGLLITAEQVSNKNSDTYDIRVSISGAPKDLEGVVRLIPDNDYYETCAYDTAITLPKGSEKQFVVQIPKKSLEDSSGTVYVQVLDHKGRELASTEFRKLISDASHFLSMGILSDSYDDLTALDLGGEALYYGGEYLNVKLYELDGSSLDALLPGLIFLVIDNFNMETLTGDQLAAIQDWVSDGGILILGTGKYAAQTTAGMEDFLDIQVTEPDEEEPISGGTQDFSSEEITRETLDYLGLEEDSLVELEDLHDRYILIGNLLSYICPAGDGSICVLPYSLTDMEALDEGYAMTLLEESSSYANSTFSRYSQDFSSYGTRLFHVINHQNNQLNTTVLNVIILFYVILVGPILYLVLRMLKKREAYWLAVPAAAFLFVVLVFFAGRGFHVTRTNVNSLSIAAADGRGNTLTYLHCYNADHNEWSLQLRDAYYNAGPLFSSYAGDTDISNYYHHIVKDGQGLHFGADPNSTFEDIYFRATGSNPNHGSIEVRGFSLDALGNCKGTITNNTGYDFSYFAVVCAGQVNIYESLGAGQQLDLEQSRLFYTDPDFDPYNGNYLYRLQTFTDRNAEGKDLLAALNLGITALSSENADFVVGVVGDYEKAVEEECNETSFGCLYTTLEH